jgi:hypothetical protein
LAVGEFDFKVHLKRTNASSGTGLVAWFGEWNQAETAGQRMSVIVTARP